ncbi:MAG: hypothetical protein HFG49_08420 [Lachnospiraceae bacterium]|nr:hypothetical protein [Lachnospiraceae bacterium]
MKHIGLTTYGINVREGKKNLEIHNILGHSLIDIIESNAKKSLNIYSDDIQSEQVFAYDEVFRKIVKNENNQELYEVLFLRVKTGEYGIESEIVDKGTGLTSYKKKMRDADVLPFGCCVMVPCGEYASGVVVLQSTGRYGIKTILSRKINEYITSINSNLRFVMGAIVPKVYMEKYLNEGILQSIRVLRYGIPDDDADKYGVDRNIKGIVEERIIKKPRGFLRHKLDDIKACMNGNKRYDEIVQIDGFDIDDLKLDFKMGSRSKTISMKNLENLIVTEDITEEVDLENGNPIFVSLCDIMEVTGEFYLRAKKLL